MIRRRRVDFRYFATVDEALEHCENALLTLRLQAVTDHDQATSERRDVEEGHSPSPPGIIKQPSLDFRAPPGGWHDTSSPELSSEMASPACEIPATILAEEHILSTMQRPDSESAVAGAAIYTPEEVQQRSLRNPEGHHQLLKRFKRQVESYHGIPDLAPIINMCDVIVCLPSYVLFDESADEHNGKSSLTIARGDKSLFIVDKGQVTLSLILPAETPGGQLTRHRIAKFGPGSVLSVGSFLASAGNAAYQVGAPTIAVSDSVCQLLRLPAQRFAALEKSDPALACRLCRMLVQVAHTRSASDMMSRIRSKRPHNHSMPHHVEDDKRRASFATLTPRDAGSSKPRIAAALSADSLGPYQLKPINSLL